MLLALEYSFDIFDHGETIVKEGVDLFDVLLDFLDVASDGRLNEFGLLVDQPVPFVTRYRSNDVFDDLVRLALYLFLQVVQKHCLFAVSAIL